MATPTIFFVEVRVRVPISPSLFPTIQVVAKDEGGSLSTLGSPFEWTNSNLVQTSFTVPIDQRPKFLVCQFSNKSPWSTLDDPSITWHPLENGPLLKYGYYLFMEDDNQTAKFYLSGTPLCNDKIAKSIQARTS